MSVQQPARKPIVVIEHCEETLSPWLLLEYRHVSLIYGKDYVWYTNIPSRYKRILSKYGTVEEKSVVDIIVEGEINPEKVIILDPLAEHELTYEALASAEYVVIGGILGDYPPRGRTREYITSKVPGNVRSYNIGKGQYSIDGSAYYINYLYNHGSLDGFRYIDGVELKYENTLIYLPFRYPVVNGKPLFADGLEYYLKHRVLPDYIWREIMNA